MGIDFDIPAEQLPRVTEPFLNSIRFLHMSTRHAPHAELKRIVRLSGGSNIACLAVKGRRCIICRKLQDPKMPRPGKIKDGIGQLNEAVLADVGYVKDSAGTTWEVLILIDSGTDWMVANTANIANIAEMVLDWIACSGVLTRTLWKFFVV